MGGQEKAEKQRSRSEGGRLGFRFQVSGVGGGRLGFRFQVSGVRGHPGEIVCY